MFVYLTFHPESLLAPLVGDVVVAVIFFRLIIFDSSSRTLIDTVYGKYVLFSLLFTSLSLCHWRARNIPSAFDVRVHVLYGYCRIYACVCVCLLVNACTDFYFCVDSFHKEYLLLFIDFIRDIRHRCIWHIWSIEMFSQTNRRWQPNKPIFPCILQILSFWIMNWSSWVYD